MSGGGAGGAGPRRGYAEAEAPSLGAAAEAAMARAGGRGLVIRLPAGLRETVRCGLFLAAGLSPPVVIIEGAGCEVRCGGPGPLLSVGAGVTAVLRGIALEGRAANGSPLVEVGPGGKAVLEGVEIRGNENLAFDSAAGARVRGGTLVMRGGGIRGNTGGDASTACGVSVGPGGVFDMRGGVIGGRGGGAVYAAGGVFNMRGGFVTGNDYTAAVYVCAGGAFDMRGGSVEGNSGLFGVWVDGLGAGGCFTMSGAARVRPEGGRNAVGLGTGRTVALRGHLAGGPGDPAADIVNGLNGRVLSGAVPGNNGKFWLKGAAGRIDGRGRVREG